MAAIARRPRLPLHAALAASLVLAACSLVKQPQVPVNQQERAVVAYGLPDCLRMTIGTAEANEGVVAALTRFMRGE